MKRKIFKYLKEIIVFTLILGVASNLISLYKSQNLNNTPLTLHSLKLLDDTYYTFPHAKPLLIHFWASWCPVCKIEASNIQHLSNYFNVVTVAVKSGDDKVIQRWLTNHHYTFKVVNDNNGILASKFSVSAYPSTFIYDKDKKLIFSEVGYTSTPGLWLRMFFAKYF